MARWRNALLVLFFVGLAALEIAHGLFRIDATRERQRRNLTERLERSHVELVASVRALLSTQRDHTAYLAGVPSLRALLVSSNADVRSRAEADVLAFVDAFRDVERVTVLDRDGVERLRCERTRPDARATSVAQLSTEPDRGALDAHRRFAIEGVSVSRFDANHEASAASERQVLHFGATMRDDAGEQLGLVVLTAYAAPVLGAVRSFEPFAGVHAVWIDDAARDVAPVLGENGGRPRVDLALCSPASIAAIMQGEPRARDESTTLLGAVLNASPPWYLVTVVPDDSLDAALGSLRGEYAWIIASMVAITAVLFWAAVFFVRLSARAFRAREAELSLRDLERQREVERQLQTTERLSSIGMLTAGVAHEINNPLEGIGNYLALLERPGVSDEKRARYVELVRHGFERIRSIVRDLLQFARPGLEHGTVDLAQVLARAQRLVGYSKQFAGVAIDLRGFDESVTVPGDAGRLEQVLINVLLNAATAMQGSGRITLTLDASALGAAEPFVELHVDDQGPGIPEANLTRIFDPFFTTTQGTGLGLAVSYGIVRAHGGTLTATNRTSGGARFTLRLPATSRALATRTS